jgi:signal transduction histidine kinase
VEIVFDYRPSPADNPARRALHQVERLQACYQKALGHELPNQLVAIQGLARILQMEPIDRLTAEGRSYLARLANLVQSVDEFVRSLAGLGRLLRDPGPTVNLALAEVAEEAATEVKVLFPALPIEYHFHQGLPVLTMARGPWHYLLVQLFRLAGESAGADHPMRIEVSGRALTEATEVTVTDNGRGWTAAELPKLFEPFGGSTTGPLGLGLFGVNQIVAGWGGLLRVASAPGQGTRFVLSIADWSDQKDEG